jgi:hypothetical protein
MKRLLVIPLAIVSLSASACSFKEKSNEQLFSSATSIFRARVTEVKLATLANPSMPGQTVEVVEARYEVKEVLKGTPPHSGIVRDLPFGPGNCSLGLLPGMEYVFVPEDHEMVLLPSGSFAYFNAEGAAVKSKLQALREYAARSTQ